MSLLWWFIIIRLSLWLNSVGSRILYEFDHRKPVLYVIPTQNIIGKLCLFPVGDTGSLGLSSTVCAQPSQAHLVTAGRVQAMVVRCGSSTRGLWDGPVICNEIRLVCGTGQSGERRQAEMHSLFYLYCLFTLFVGKVRLIKIMQII
jgi:hypothetical protein